MKLGLGMYWNCGLGKEERKRECVELKLHGLVSLGEEFACF